MNQWTKKAPSIKSKIKVIPFARTPKIDWWNRINDKIKHNIDNKVERSGGITDAAGTTLAQPLMRLSNIQKEA